MHALIALLKSPFMVLWHVTIEIMLVIIYLLEDEQELSLGMLIHPKRIYNFCLFHAHLGDIAMCFATLSYLFHIFGLTYYLSTPSASFCLLMFVNCRFIPIFTMPKKSKKNI